VDTFSEISRIKKLQSAPTHGLMRVRELAKTESRGKSFPLYSIEVGSEDKTTPTLGLFGGVHGLERVGAQTVLAYLESLAEQLSWDTHLRESFEHVRIVSMPMINPIGTFFGTRSNGNGVDLMRNSPVEAVGTPARLIGGHRVSPKLPYYRGALGAPMEVESKALIEYVQTEIYPSSAAIMLDVHSGFGIQDRLWYPFAKSTEVFPQMHHIEGLRTLLDRSYPNHIYIIESQSVQYTTHGDLWDHLYGEWVKLGHPMTRLFCPITLEMGSWMWVRKNPLQLFSAMGRFNPIKQHRYKRTMRRHLPLFDFLLRATRNFESWT
jgi:predicted deacylase